MKLPIVFEALSDIDDDLLSEAAEPHKQRRYLNKYIAAAACIILCAVMGLATALRGRKVTKPLPYEELTLQEAYEYGDLGELLPTLIPEGYYLDGEVGVYDGEVMKATFISSSSGNAVTIEIAEKSLFKNARFGAVVFEESGAQLFAQNGDYAACYSLEGSVSSERKALVDMMMSSGGSFANEDGEAAMSSCGRKCKHLYYSIQHGKILTTEHSYHLDSSGGICHVVRIEYEHRMYCGDCGDYIGSYVECCTETHSVCDSVSGHGHRLRRSA